MNWGSRLGLCDAGPYPYSAVNFYALAAVAFAALCLLLFNFCRQPANAPAERNKRPRRAAAEVAGVVALLAFMGAQLEHSPKLRTALYLIMVTFVALKSARAALDGRRKVLGAMIDVMQKIGRAHV